MATTSPATSPIGRDTLRIDGPRKVTGLAQYTSDFNFPGMLYAVPVEATIANGKLVALDTAAAEKMPGVRAVYHRENIGKISRARIALGGVGTKPWRAAQAEAALTSKPANDATFRQAAEAALQGAKAQSENRFKIELAKRCLTHALRTAAAS